MLSYMEYLSNCFNVATGWNSDGFANITSTSRRILDFTVPSNVRLEVSSQVTPQLALSFMLSNKNAVNGSVSYFYSSVDLKTEGTRDIDVRQDPKSHNHSNTENDIQLTNNAKTEVPRDRRGFPGTFLYGRMYFPGSALEAMVIKLILQNTRILAKCISNPHLASNGTMIMYLQRSTPRLLSEAIYSTNEALVGLRCLYLFFSGDDLAALVGTEIWYAASSMLPGLLTAFRYSLRATDTPLTMTLAMNPILGHLSLTYSVKTSPALMFSSRYDFNLYSYNSNLTVGFELYRGDRYRKMDHEETRPPLVEPSVSRDPIEPRDSGKPGLGVPEDLSPGINSITSINGINVSKGDVRYREDEICGSGRGRREEVSDTFSSVLKFSTSLNDRLFSVLWEGRLQDFLVSTGAKVNLDRMYLPEIAKFGVSFSYSC